MVIIRLYNDRAQLGYFKEWSPSARPVLSDDILQAFQFTSLELAERTARWIPRMGAHHKCINKDIQHELQIITHGTV